MLKTITKYKTLCLMALTFTGSAVCSEETTPLQTGIDFMKAAADGNVLVIRQMLSSFPSLANFFLYMQGFPKACNKPENQKLGRFIKENIDSMRNATGLSPLAIAAFFGQTEIARILIQHGANIEPPQCVVPALICAAQNGHVDTCRLLLQHNANTESTDHYEKTALYTAALKGHEQVISVLLQYHANIEAASRPNPTPLHAAVEKGQYRCAEILLENRANTEAQNFMQESALQVAVKKGAVDLVQLLIKYGADVEKKDQIGRTLVRLLIEPFQREESMNIQTKKAIIKLLIGAGAAVSERTLTRMHAKLPGYAPQIEQALEEEGRRRAFAESPLPTDVNNLICSFQQYAQEAKCNVCNLSVRDLPTLELFQLCSRSPLHRICRKCTEEKLLTHTLESCTVCNENIHHFA